MSKSQVSLPSRSRRYSVGKEIGGAVYLHQDYEHLLGTPVQEAKKHLPAAFNYTIVKYHLKTDAVSFIQSPDFDSSPEPTVGDIWTISRDRRSELRRQLADPYIYHHKWLFVNDDYMGFNVAESKVRSLVWMSLPDVDRRRIGRKSYWFASVLPRLGSAGNLCPMRTKRRI